MTFRLMVLFCCFALCGVVFAEAIDDPALRDLLRDAPTVKDYPRDDAIYLLREMEITITKTGGFDTRERKLVKILTPQGLSQANWEIPFDNSCETVELLRARTLVGEEAFPVDPAQIGESAVYPGVAWYDSLVLRRFSMPAAAVGAVFEVETMTRRPLPRVPGEFNGRLSQQHQFPLLEGRYIVHLPIEKRLNVRFSGKEKPAIEEKVAGDVRTYSWVIGKVPSLSVREPMTPPRADLVPSARLTTMTSWEPTARWYSALTEGKDELTDPLRNVAARLTTGCKDEQAKIAALHKAVRELPYVAMEMGTLRDVPHSADEVLRQNYGDCKDKATLLRGLLRAVGIESWYVLVHTTDGGRFDPQLYGASEFNHVILLVKTASGDQYLDATLADIPTGALPAGVEGASALLIRGKGELRTLPVSPAADNGADIRINITIKPGGAADGRVVITFSGLQAMEQRGLLSSIPVDRYQEALESSLAPRLGNEARVEEVAVKNLREPSLPLVITARFTSPAFLQEAGDMLSGSLPIFVYQTNQFSTAKTRQFPFRQEQASVTHVATEIKLPAGMTVVSLPKPARHDCAFGAFSDSCTVKGQVIRYACDMTMLRGEFAADKLAEMKKWASVLALEKRNLLQFYLRATK